MTAKDECVKTIGRIGEDLKKELGREPSEREIAARLTLLFSVGIGAIASARQRPEACIEYWVNQAQYGATEVSSEITNSKQARGQG